MRGLQVGRFERESSSAKPLELLTAEGLGIRWDVAAFGLERMEFTVACRNKWEFYERYNNHLGYRVACWSPWHHRPMSGYVAEVAEDGPNRVRYVVRGPGWRLYDELDTDVYPSATSLNTLIGTVLNDHVAVATKDTSHIASNITTTGGWQVQYPQGSYPGDIIKQMLDKSDSTGSVWDFWLLDEVFSGLQLGLWLPYYQKRQSGTINWRVRLADLRDVAFSRDINGLKTNVTVYYGTVSGTATGGSNTTLVQSTADFITSGVKPGDTVTNLTTSQRAGVTAVTATTLTLDGLPNATTGTATGGSTTTLVNTGANFVAEGVRVGDVLVNTTDNSTGTVTAVATTTLTIGGAMSGGASNANGENYKVQSIFKSGDGYAIELQTPLAANVQTSSATATYWDVQYAEFRRDLNSVQATQYAQFLSNGEAGQAQSFTIGAPRVRDGNGRWWPLWEMVAQGGGYLQVEDMYPEFASFSGLLNTTSTFFITSMDYDATSNSLRVTVDNPDRRLDARLRDLGVFRTAMVSRKG